MIPSIYTQRKLHIEVTENEDTLAKEIHLLIEDPERPVQFIIVNLENFVKAVKIAEEMLARGEEPEV